MYLLNTEFTSPWREKALSAQRQIDRQVCCKSHYRFKCHSCGKYINRGDKITMCEKSDGLSLRFRGGGGIWKKDKHGVFLIGIYAGIYGPNNWVHIGCTPYVYKPLSNPQLVPIGTKWNKAVNDEFYDSGMKSYRHFIKTKGYPKQKQMKKRIIKNIIRFQSIWRGYYIKHVI
tara:strand:- start:6191 stop:6709 length:519 start_codon:yes stop_codon:yes gene_type:complete